MYPRRRRRLLPRLLWLISSVVLYFLIFGLPSPPPTTNNNRADKKAPDYDVESTPRYLYRSSFRSDPDLSYEKNVSDALVAIETAVRQARKGDDTAQQHIWQIHLGRHKSQRGQDSLLFQQVNRDQWDYSLVTTLYAKTFINTVFASVPELQTLYKSYPHHVLRADLLRYLLLWYYGGFYADTDAFPARPIANCPALLPFFDANDTPQAHSLVLGVEIDEPHASAQLKRDWHWSRSYGFGQYTMFAPRRFSPILREAIVRVLSHTRQHRQRHGGVLGAEPAYDESTILEVTGPGVFTDAVIDVLSRTLAPTHWLVQRSVAADEGIGDLAGEEGGSGSRRVTWAPFHEMRDPLCVGEGEGEGEGADGGHGGLCVLPVSVWGNGQRHSSAEGFGSAQACVNHRFGRVWKKGWWEYLFG
ncbi:hypothetical protein P168DRAFT_305956 [Aspergillus campestris IBT 28561]|uniref:Uncharacterized protein n=1 Tax=Aspergillus campestris (strain IBT 28561) TaxID=1392248 RepID=A0A2I1CYK8_ASPC2|nr:uncharacterized protein P168DRAFT_305956 [Aspergillus campestris IBT 28561]PKY02696.1 hypothetical protein P168DRAFT_305956 [Aspergillus campestris IBT 28561]